MPRRLNLWWAVTTRVVARTACACMPTEVVGVADSNRISRAIPSVLNPSRNSTGCLCAQCRFDVWG